MKKGTFKHSEEAKQRISEARKKKMLEQGFINSPETRQRISDSRKGVKLSPEHVLKISQSLKGRKPVNFEKNLAKAHAMPKPTGKDNPNWKGDAVGYSALHAWVSRELGKPNKCGKCGTETAKRYEWANISKEYKRDLFDWKRLCVSCHRQEGFEQGEYETWNKGKKTGLVPKTAFKKGEHRSKQTEFQKGLIPHNKYLEPKQCLVCCDTFQPRENTRKFCSRKCYWKSLVKSKET